MNKSSLIILLIFLCLMQTTPAHQPRIVKSNFFEINNPEVSQAFYGELKGSSNKFFIRSNQEFKLYIGLLLPDLPQIHKDISIKIDRIKDKKSETLALLDGSNFNWTPFFERFSQDHYLWGPEYKAKDSIKGVILKGQPVSAGKYQITVFSPSNIGKYVLVTGFIETFPLTEILHAAIAIPYLKAHFFNYSFAKLAISPYIWGYLLIIYILAFVFGFIYRLILKKFAKNSIRKLDKNIGKPDRLFRAAIGVGLFFWAVTTSWSPLVLFASGFAFFEAIFSWCGLYAILGKNSCPI